MLVLKYLHTKNLSEKKKSVRCPKRQKQHMFASIPYCNLRHIKSSKCSCQNVGAILCSESMPPCGNLLLNINRDTWPLHSKGTDMPTGVGMPGPTNYVSSICMCRLFAAGSTYE